MDTKLQEVVTFTKKLLEIPLLGENLKQDPILKSLSVIRRPNPTKYKFTPQEWQQIHEIINSAILHLIFINF
ncbi:EVE domain-containing protein [Ancylothrix sp. C2]|uniref:EVE domain-containing protein n=1 Tax=Ancylothrix sp. D3o TaxID=2953691 RepID=UPI0021BB85B6|nr:EVE domain-containing protein [Ancylothrix sp. D3o]MCT7952566.1 EVE domain-containing protein [Ancylothrix sp. D3o]